jgi:hypothetical protein
MRGVFSTGEIRVCSQNKNVFPIYCEGFPRLAQSKSIAAAISEAMHITQAPEPMVCQAILSAVSVSLQGGIDIEMPFGKTCPVTLNCVTVAESGERKTGLLTLTTQGIKSFQKKSLKKYKKEVERYQIKFGVHKKKTALIEKKVSLDDEKQYAEMVDELLEHQKLAPVKPKLPLLLFEDSTLEALLSSLTKHIPNGYLYTSEGGIILNSRLMSNTPYLNSIWSGDDVTVNRKSEDSYTLEYARLGVNIMIQWSALERYLKNNKDDVRGNGWLSRLIFSAPDTNCGYRQVNGIECTREGLNAYNDRLYHLLSETAELDDYTCKKVVRFSDDAKRIWFDVYNDIEFKMRPDGMYFYAKDHASKLPENIARVAALIHCFDNSPDEDRPTATLIEAINLVAYYSGQFMKVFCAPPKYITDAEDLFQWLARYANSGVRYIKRNKILQFGPVGVRKKKELDAALDYLKLNNPLGELMAGKARVFDLWPQHHFNADKLAYDLKLNVTF